MTGFEPFGGDAVNASEQAVQGLAQRWADRTIELRTAILPVSFDGAPAALAGAIATHEPDVVLCVGEAGGRAAITPERFAVNERSARIPDNDGRQPDGAIDEGPQRLEARVDVDFIAESIKAAGMPAEVSEDAGRFVCNATFHAALTAFDGPAGFIHVPAVRDSGPARVGAETDGGTPVEASLGIDDLVAGLEAAVRSLLVSMGPWPASI